MSMKKNRFFQRVLGICIILGSNLMRPSLKCSGALDGSPSKKRTLSITYQNILINLRVHQTCQNVGLGWNIVVIQSV